MDFCPSEQWNSIIFEINTKLATALWVILSSEISNIEILYKKAVVRVSIKIVANINKEMTI